MASLSHIKPGEKGKIDATIDIKGRRGNISKSIKVFTNDPKSPVVVLRLRAVIQ